MKYGEYVFKDFQEYKNIVNLALFHKVKTIQDFHIFLEKNFSYKRGIKC